MDNSEWTVFITRADVEAGKRFVTPDCRYIVTLAHVDYQQEDVIIYDTTCPGVSFTIPTYRFIGLAIRLPSAQECNEHPKYMLQYYTEIFNPNTCYYIQWGRLFKEESVICMPSQKCGIDYSRVYDRIEPVLGT